MVTPRLVFTFAASVFLAGALLSTACGPDATLSAQGGGGDADGTGAADQGLSDASTTDADDRGDFLEPCEDDGDCLSGYCLQAGDDLVCTELCAPGTCPEGWGCRVLENTGADAVRICVPNPDTLCGPCQNNVDCGGAGRLCIDVGGARVCGRDCSEGDEVCPEGYFCSLRADPTGARGQQCVPLTEQCSCRPEADGSERDCVRQNGVGICEGFEVCLGQEGWSACTANVPTDEICDGLDNDCDGLVDEGLDPRPCLSTPNEIGTCEGTETCRGTDGWVCDAQQAAIETCDGLDNDCNGVADDGLCFDGNPCTHDLCDPDNPGACSYPPRTGECDDGDVCTQNDRCDDSACVGSPRDCDDDNGCTADSCDAVAGCQHSDLSDVACETGNFCTADMCQDGACITGPAEQCGGSNACNTAGCNPSTGCTLERLTGNPCNDGDPCSVQDLCSNGTCVPGQPYCAGRPCSNCTGETWNLDLGAWCVEILDTPTCFCVCIGG